MPFDVRQDRPYDAYAELDFDVPVGTTGDGWDRYMVRMEEMRQANRMIRQCVEGMPEGDFTAKVPKMIRPAEGEVYASVESARGETGVHLVSDGSANPYRYRYRGPSLYRVPGARGDPAGPPDRGCGDDHRQSRHHARGGRPVSETLIVIVPRPRCTRAHAGQRRRPHLHAAQGPRPSAHPARTHDTWAGTGSLRR